MSTRKMTSEYRAAQWMQIIQDRQASGYTVKDYCKEKGISRDSYFYWQNKLRNSAAENMRERNQLQGRAPRGWLQLAGDNKAAIGTINIEINGCKISVDNNTDPELLKNVCRILRTI